jgi:hypothetical protein
MAGRPDKTAEGTIQWACQNGVMLNPDLRDKERWDMKLESTSSRGSKTVSGTVWTRGMESPETRRPNRTIHLPPDGLEPLLAFGSNVLMQVTLEKFPDGVYAGDKGSCGKGTNWLADLQRPEK